MRGFASSRTGSPAWRYWVTVLHVQAGIADRGQVLQAGFTRDQLAHRLHSGSWQRVHPGVYATFSGPLSREALLWAALRRAGQGAMLSHETAAELHGLLERPSRAIHVTVPIRRRPAQRRSVPGLVVHRSDQSRADFVGPYKLPRTRIEDTVLDLVAAAPTFDRGYSWIAGAVSRKLVRVDDLHAALTSRPRVRWRAWLTDALVEAQGGAHSALELRYVRDVEQAHGLPRSRRQERREVDGSVQYRDNWYAEYRLIVEIDGPGYHQNERVQLDKDRDNVNLAAADIRTYRFGPVGVTQRACETAAMVAVALQRGGWRGTPRPCRRPGCRLASSNRRNAP